MKRIDDDYSVTDDNDVDDGYDDFDNDDVDGKSFPQYLWQSNYLPVIIIKTMLVVKLCLNIRKYPLMFDIILLGNIVQETGKEVTDRDH